MPEFEALRRTGRDIKDHALAHLDLYLEEFERNATAAGSKVHWASTAAEACDIVLGICRETGARVVTKSKSMVSEEIGLNARLEAGGLEVVETDLGEYVIQLRGETPSHLIAPVIHLSTADIAEDFLRHHDHLPPDRDTSSPAVLIAEARGILRPKFLSRRRRHHGSQPARRQDRLGHRRDERGQRRPDADAAARAHRGDLDREGGADAR